MNLTQPQLIIFAIIAVAFLYLLARIIKGKVTICEIKGTIIKAEFFEGSTVAAAGINIISLITLEPDYTSSRDLSHFKNELQKENGEIIKFTNMQSIGKEGDKVTLSEVKNTYLINQTTYTYFVKR